MSVKKNDLVQFIGGLQTLTDEVPEIMTKIAVGEGVYAVKQARLICTNDSPDIVNTGDYRRNWKSDQTAKRAGRRFIVRFYNPLDYAGHLEHGFRSHFVPGHWECWEPAVYKVSQKKTNIRLEKEGQYYVE